MNPLQLIRRQIAEGQLSEAALAALTHAEACQIAPAANGLTALSAQLEETRRQWNTGQLSFDDYSRAHAQTAHKLADWLDQLPEQATPGAAKRMLREEVFKKRLFWLLALGKLLVIGRLLYHWSTGGFNKEQLFSSIGLLAPAFAAYLFVMLDDSLHHRNTHVPRYVSGPLVRIAYWLLPAYALALMFLLELKVMNTLTFTEMTAGLALVESVLGGYVGKIVQAFFKKAE
mgnify:CR=1 FL=1|jgi:hypothetical protein